MVLTSQSTRVELKIINRHRIHRMSHSKGVCEVQGCPEEGVPNAWMGERRHFLRG